MINNSQVPFYQATKSYETKQLSMKSLIATIIVFDEKFDCNNNCISVVFMSRLDKLRTRGRKSVNVPPKRDNNRMSPDFRPMKGDPKINRASGYTRWHCCIGSHATGSDGRRSQTKPDQISVEVTVNGREKMQKLKAAAL